MAFLIRAYKWLIRFGWYLAPVVLLLVRLAWGLESYQSGRGHLSNLDTTTKFFESLHIPAPKANATATAVTVMIFLKICHPPLWPGWPRSL